jgi:2-methylcitrate dehydratase PrpD
LGVEKFSAPEGRRRVESPETLQSLRRWENLVRSLSRLRSEDIPPPVERKVRLHLIDSLGVMVAGSRLPEARAGREGLERAPPGSPKAWILGWSGDFGLLSSAFQNAVHLDLLEAQDGDRRGGFHPCEGAVPVALALAGLSRARWRDLLLSLLVGYETSLRFGRALFPIQSETGHYPDGTCNAVGAAMTAQWLLDPGPEGLLSALATSGFVLPLSLRPGLTGRAKGLLAGVAAETGLRAALWAREGHGAGAEVLLPPWDPLSVLTAGGASASPLPKGPPPWLTLATYLKPFPGGRHAHGPVEALRSILRAHPSVPSKVRSIEVQTYAAAVQYTGRPPHEGSPLAQLTQSLPYLLAITVIDGQPLPSRFLSEERWTPELQRLLPRIRVRSDPSMTRGYPRRTLCRVTLRTEEGDRWAAQRVHRWGDPERPMSISDVQGKFLEMLRPVLPGRVSERLFDHLWKARGSEVALEVLDRVQERILSEGLTPAPS